MKLGKYSLGIGDRFGFEGPAQLRALETALERGVRITPVWNKSHREHSIIGTLPGDTRRRADEAVRVRDWRGAYHVDADHIGMGTVDGFLGPCDFFTIDVAGHIGKPAPPGSEAAYLEAVARFRGTLRIPGLSTPVEVTDDLLAGIARKYLSAVEEAGRVYRRIAEGKGEGHFITEVSIDEADAPQTPAELFFVLAAAAGLDVPVQTIAPKFSGAFLKGIDYVGDTGEFAREFEDDLAVVEFARKTFGLPDDLKLSIHSGSDKFSLYPLMRRAIIRAEAGIHLKTAGTTWLEEVVGLAAAGGEGLVLAKDIYAAAVERFDELTRPYQAVIQIDRSSLPPSREVNGWGAQDYVDALRHDPACRRFNRNFRQLIHVSFRIAAEMGSRFTSLSERHRDIIEAGVVENILRRHVEPLFLSLPAGEDGRPPEGAGTRGVPSAGPGPR